jgi:ribosomal protein S18 acetylase RimI-like enzyme
VGKPGARLRRGHVPGDGGLLRFRDSRQRRRPHGPVPRGRPRLLSYPRYSYTPSEAYVERLVVSPTYRRQGIARLLLAGAEELARDSGKESVGLHVSGNNLAALRLYEAEGYAEAGRQRSFLTSQFLDIREWLYLQKEL